MKNGKCSVRCAQCVGGARMKDESEAGLGDRDEEARTEDLVSFRRPVTRHGSFFCARDRARASRRRGAHRRKHRRPRPACDCYCTFRVASLRVLPAASVIVTVQSPAIYSVLVAHVRQGLPPMRRSTGNSWSLIFQTTFSVSPAPPSTRSQ